MNCKANTQKIAAITLLILALSMCTAMGVAIALTSSYTSVPLTQSNPCIEQAAPAQVWTDKADYHPGEHVTIYGSGFLANSPVSFVITKLKDNTTTNWSTDSDAVGNLTTTYQIDPQGAPLYKIDATDGQNNASYTFKDSTYRLTLIDTTTGSGVSSIPLGHITMHPGDSIIANGTIDGDEAYQYGYEVTFNSGTYVHNPVNRIAEHYNNPLMINPLIFRDKTWTVSPSTPLGSYRISAWGFNSNAAEPDIELCHILVEIVSPSTKIPTKLLIFGSNSLTAGTVGGYNIILKDGSDNVATLSYDLNVDLSASSGTWYSDAGCTNPITSVSISSGSSVSAMIYYKHATSPTVSLSAQADAMNAGSKNVIVSGIIVSQPITVTMANGAPSAIVTINGGNPSPSSFAADGTPHIITMDSEASFMLSFVNRGSTARNGFSVNSAFSDISSMFTASTSAISVNAYQQFKITPYYTVTGGSPSTYFNNAVSYTSTGISKTATPTQGASGGSDIWADYSTAITYKSPILESDASKRWIIASDDTTTNTMLASVTSSRPVTANYYYQYKATFRYTTQDDIAIPAGNHIGSYLNCNSMLYVDSGSSYGATSATSVWHDYSSPTNVWFQSYTAASGNERWYPSASEGYYETGTITNNYIHQYKVTFTASGGNILSDSLGTILTVYGSSAKSQAALPYSAWVANGSPVAWAYSSPVAGPSIYVWTSTSGLGTSGQSGVLTVGSAGTVTGVYTSVTISLEQTSGNVGDTVTLHGSGFDNSQSFTVTYGTATVASGTTTATGTFPTGTTFTVPASTAGAHTVTVTQGSNSASATYTVNPKIILSPSSGNVGDRVTLTATGMLGSHSDCIATFAGSSPLTLSSSTTDSNGGLTATFTVPASTSGSKSVVLSDGTNNYAATITVNPKITLAPSSGLPGAPVTVIGTGFGSSSTVTLTYDSVTQTTTPSTVPTSSSGDFICYFTVPASTAGGHTVKATQGSNFATATYTATTVSQLIIVTMANGAPAATVTINGGNPSPSTFTADGNLHIITMDPGASFTLSFDNSGGTTTRNGFNVASSFSETSSTYIASTTAIALTAYRQFQITPYYTVSSGSPVVSDAVGYTSVGVSKTDAPTSGSSGGSTIWADRGTAVTYKSPIAGTTSERWIISSSDTTKHTVINVVTASQTVTANYYHQYKVTFTASANVLEDGSGTTLTLNSVAESAKTLPISNWYNRGQTITWAYSSPVTGESHNYHWTSTSGLATGQSGTLTINNYGTITGNYDSAAATSLTVSCFKSTVDRGTTTTISGALTTGASGVSGKTISLSYFKDGSWISIESATTETDGSYSYTWTIPTTLVNGEYPLKAEFAGDSAYQASSAVTETVGNGGNLFVVPEVGGALGALLACVGGALVFTKLRSKRGGKA